MSGTRFQSWSESTQLLTTSHPQPLINRIPVEILCRVFTATFKPSSPTNTPSYLPPHDKNLTLLKVTAVCRHWRSTATECATLWTNIAFSTSALSTIQCATLFFGRSKEALLSVHICDPGNARDPSSVRLLRRIARQSHRISICELSSPSPQFWKYWSFPAPKLRRLAIQGHGVQTPPLFRGEIPQLGTFVALYHSPWPLGKYAVLRQADLRNHNRYVTLESFLDALRGCKLLEKLTLHGYARLGKTGPRPTTLSLPHLRQLDIFSCDSALILEHFDAPSLIGPVIVFDSSPQRHILSSLPESEHTPPYLQGVANLHIVLNSYSAQYYVAGYREDGCIAFYVGVCGVGHWFRWLWVQESIGAVASFAHFSDIRSLMFSTDAPAVPWDLWLPNLTRVRELTVSCPKSEGLLTTLIGTSPEGGLPFCPSLFSLGLYRCGRCAVVDHVSLLEFVLSRYRARRPLRKLKLHRDEWDWVREMDQSWVVLAQSQCKFFRPISHVSPTNTPPAIKGDDVQIELPLEVDLREVDKKFYLYGGRLNLIDWERTSFPMT